MSNLTQESMAFDAEKASITPVISVRDVRVSAEADIVDPISFDVYAGSPLTILGETGSGKSLISQAIMGNLPEGLTASGSVKINGAEVLTLPRKAREAMWGRDISILPQEPWHALDPTMRALPQVSETYRFVKGRSEQESQTKASADLHDLGLKGSDQHKLPMQLSGGMAQRAVFAAAKAGGAPIVIVDEPTKGLDASRRDDVVAMLKSAVDDGGALLTITHDIAVARQLGGYIMVMRKGVLLEEGPAAEILANPQSDYAKALVAADPQSWDDPTHKDSWEQKSAILTAKDICVQRGQRVLLSGFDLTVHAGEIIGITGDSGCGKSSLGDTLLGVLPSPTGSVLRQDGVAKHRYVKLFQDPPTAFSRHWTIGTLLKDLVKLHGLDASRIPPLMERLALEPDLLTRSAGGISGGELQRFSILRALLLDPVYMFADEPTSRLDPVTQKEIMDLLISVARETSCAVLLVSHDKALIEHVCDRKIAL